MLTVAGEWRDGWGVSDGGAGWGVGVYRECPAGIDWGGERV